MQKRKLGQAEEKAENHTSHSGHLIMDHSVQTTLTSDPVEQELFRPDKIVNVASVKHRSPFRYPGGKTWLVPLVRRWISSLSKHVDHFVEPFAGGAIVSLSVLFDELADKITLIEKDTCVGMVWQTIVSGSGPELAEKIVQFDLTEENAHRLFDETFPLDDVLSRALATIVRNRIQRGGIMAPGASFMKNGENGKGLKSRWYPETLKNRLLDLHARSQHIGFISGDGMEFMEANANDPNIVWFIDPPYTLAGRRLYTHYNLDHEKLFEVAASLQGAFLMTYDNSDYIKELARKHDFNTAEIAMKNTHHSLMTELLVSEDLSWMES